MRKFRVEGWPIHYGNEPGGIVVEVDDVENEAAALVQAVIDHGDCALGSPESTTVRDQRASEFKIWVTEVKA